MSTPRARARAPREGRRGRSTILEQHRTVQDRTLQDKIGLERTPQDSPGLTQEEIDLLGSNGIVRGQDGAWVHIEKEPSGRTIITPVNHLAELRAHNFENSVARASI